MTSGSAYKNSVTQRLAQRARVLGLDPNVLLKRLAFQRILARLALDERWVLKGGFVMELRLGLAARTTKDLDLVLRDEGTRWTAQTVQDLIDEALDVDLDDRMTFEVRVPKAVVVDGVAGSTWGVSVRVLLDGTELCVVRLDVVTRAVDMGEARDALRVDPVLPGLEGCGPVTVAAVDPAQHAAEKLHACVRTYAHDRPSSRDKGLVDLVLLEEAGLVERRALGVALDRVFRARDREAPPVTLPALPVGWRSPYEAKAEEMELTARSFDDAVRAVTVMYEDALHGLDDERKDG